MAEAIGLDASSTAKELRDAAYGDPAKQWLDAEAGRGTAKKLGMNEATFEKSREVFFDADKDNSGSISVAELRELLDSVLPSKLGDSDFETVVNKFDENHDGSLNFDEFLEILADTKVYQNGHLSEMIDIMGDEVRKQMQFERLTPAEKLKVNGVATTWVVKYVVGEIGQMNSCLQLPMAIAIFLSFVGVVLLHERIDVLHAVDKGITWDIDENANFAFGGSVPFENGRMGHKNIQDVNTFADFWSWFNMGLVPLFWKSPTPGDWEVSEFRTNVIEKCKSHKQILEEYGWNESLLRAINPSTLSNHTFAGLCPEGQADQEVLNFPYAWFGTPPAPTYKFYFNPLGGLRLRQERTDIYECPGSAGYERKLHPGPCLPEVSWLRPEVRQAFFSDEKLMNGPGAENVFLLSGWSQQEVRVRLRQLENQAWLNPYTSKVELLYPLYNAHIGTVSAVYIVFFMNRAGHFYRMIQPVTFWLQPYHGWWNYAVDILWLSLIAKIGIQESIEVAKLMMSHGVMPAVKIYFSISNFIDWMNVFYVVALVILWRIHLQKLGVLHDLLRQANSQSVLGSFEDSSTREAFFLQIDYIVRGGEIRRIAVALYPIMVVTRFFKAFSAQPRLALVTQTITRASTDLFHFGLVFSCIFGLFTLSAIVLFGQDLADFANMTRAADSVFHVLLGDFDWDLMKDVGRLPATIWFWTFILLVNMVMLNMLLAVIMDVYTEVRGAIGSHAETLWSQAWEIFRRWRQLKTGHRVSLEHVAEHVSPEDEAASKAIPTTLNVASFMALVPGLGEKQAQRILIESLIAQEDELLISQSMAEGMLDIQRIDRRVNHIHGSLQNLMKMSEMGINLLKQSLDPDHLHDSVPKDERLNAWRNDASPRHLPQNTILDSNGKLPLELEKVEDKLQEPSWEKPPPWFQSFAASTLQRFESLDRLEARVDKLTTAVEALVAGKAPQSKPLQNTPPMGGGFCSVSKA